MSLIIAKFTRGPYSLDINDSTNYSIGANFRPPTVALTNSMAVGTSANRYGGGELVGEKANSREFSFNVNVFGGSGAQVEANISRLDTFIRSGTPDEPVYLEVRTNSNVSAEPLWGQFGANLRYKVISGSASASGTLTFGHIQHGAQPDCTVRLLVAPYALGKRQRLAQAKGTILEYKAGTVFTQGMVLASTTTNYFTNPVFGNATYDTNWSVSDATLVKSQNLNTDFLLYGKSSCLLVNTDSSTARNLIESITLGDTNQYYLSCYAKRPDGGAITSSDAQLFYGSAQTTTFRSIGNGWYLLEATVTGIAAGTNTGIQIAAKRSLYVDGFLLNQNAGLGLFFYGDMLGCAWSGTAHASTSTSVPGMLKAPIDHCLNMSFGTIRMVFEMYRGATEINTVRYLLEDSSDNLGLYFEPADDKFYIEDGTSTDSTAAQTFVAGDRLVLHLCYDPSGMILYVNGAATTADMAYKPPTAATSLYIGSDNTPSIPFPCFWKDISTFNIKMTAAQVLADYNNIVEALSTDVLSPIPYEWTKDGDSIVDMYNDATHDNFALISGIPGSAPADSIIHAVNSAAGRALILSNNPFDRYLDMNDTFLDRSGTADTDALSGEVEVATVDTTEDEVPASTRISIADNREAYYNQPAYIFAAIKDAGSNLRARLKCNFTIDLVLAGDYQSLAADTTFRQFLIGPLRMPYGPERQFEWVGASSTLNFYAGFIRSSGSTDISFDFYQFLSGQIAYIVPAGANGREYLVREGRAWLFNSGATVQRETPEYRGDPIRFEPGKINHLVVLSGAHAGAVSLTATTTLSRVYVIPRYAIL